MTLHDAVAQYVTHQQSVGIRFSSDARVLKSFCRRQGDRELAQITPEVVLAFLAGHGPPTSFWLRKHGALRGFYRFAIARGYIDRSPLPTRVPKLPNQFVPYIYSHAELQRLLAATDACFADPRSLMDPVAFRTLLLLLYGAGLRISEALALTLADVDLERGLLCIRESKFYRTRLVPIGPDLTAVLANYLTHRRASRAGPEAPLLVRRTGDRVTRRAAEWAFGRLRARAQVRRDDGARYQPRLHDMRHTSATHRLVAWYQQGADVQRLLPQLATYLGHIHLGGTQRYLTLTPQLLQHASQRFARYAWGGAHA